jgi:hypothetical protein
MFADEPAEEVIKSAKKISDLKKFGCFCQKAFCQSGHQKPPGVC